MNRSVSIKFTIDQLEAETVYDIEDKTFQHFQKVGKGVSAKQNSGFTNYESLSPELQQVFTILIGETSFD